MSRWWFQISNIFYFHPYLGKISNLTNIFQMGWNHQLVHLCSLKLQKCGIPQRPANDEVLTKSAQMSQADKADIFSFGRVSWSNTQVAVWLWSLFAPCRHAHWSYWFMWMFYILYLYIYICVYNMHPSLYLYSPNDCRFVSLYVWDFIVVWWLCILLLMQCHSWIVHRTKDETVELCMRHTRESFGYTTSTNL